LSFVFEFCVVKVTIPARPIRVRCPRKGEDFALIPFTTLPSFQYLYI